MKEFDTQTDTQIDRHLIHSFYKGWNWPVTFSFRGKKCTQTNRQTKRQTNKQRDKQTVIKQQWVITIRLIWEHLRR